MANDLAESEQLFDPQNLSMEALIQAIEGVVGSTQSGQKVNSHGDVAEARQGCLVYGQSP